MTRMTIDQIAQVALDAGFAGDAAAVAVAVALAESGGNPDAANEHGEHSYGLWQINLDFWGRPNAIRTFTREELLDPLGAASAAYLISHFGTDWSAWSAYTRKTYLAYLPQAQAAVARQLGLPQDLRRDALESLLTARVLGAIAYNDRRLAAIVDQIIVPLALGRRALAERRLRYLYALAGKTWPDDG